MEEKEIKNLQHEVVTLTEMIDLVPHAIFLKDSNRRFIKINKAVADHHGVAKEEMLGKRDEDFFAQKDAKAFIDLENKILQQKIKVHEEERFTIETETKYMDSIKLPFFIKHKQEWGILGISLDITSRKKLLEERTHLQLEHQKKMMRAVVDTQERERKNIAQDLHDGIGQILSAANINLDAVMSKASIDPEKSLATAKELINQAIQEVRAVTKNLVPNILKDFGLVEALEKLADSIKSTGKFEVFFSSTDKEVKLSEQIEMNIYRIAQEIVNNAIKHSEANEISIQLFSRDQILIIQIEDDGKGFDLQSVLTHGAGLGLSSIQNRCDLINADLNIDTQPGHGCSYSFTIKLSEHYD